MSVFLFRVTVPGQTLVSSVELVGQGAAPCEQASHARSQEEARPGPVDPAECNNGGNEAALHGGVSAVGQVVPVVLLDAGR